MAFEVLKTHKSMCTLGNTHTNPLARKDGFKGAGRVAVM